MNDADTTLDYCSPLEKAKYNVLLQRMPDDWYYRTVDVTYKLNNYGHRSKNIDEIDTNNYILFIGDSHTFGVGLELEKTYAYLTAQDLNMTYYNLSVGGTGLDFMFYNLNMWLTKFPKPKYISICWTDPHRVTLATKDNIAFSPTGSWSKQVDEQQLIIAGNVTGYFRTRALLYYNLLESIFNFNKVPYSSISFYPLYPTHFKFKNFGCNQIDGFARDGDHGGNKLNRAIADYIISDYKTKYSNATVHSAI